VDVMAITIKEFLDEALTPAQADRVTRDMTKHAGGENVEVEKHGDTLYVFGSELATLRIFRKYEGGKNINQGWNKGTKSFYFSLRM